MKWIKGRQGTGYEKFVVLYLTDVFDLLIIRYKKGDYIPKHVDKLDSDKKHYRLNILLKGEDSFECERVIFKWYRFCLFRPDLYEHEVKSVKRTRYVLSIGLAV